VAALRAKRVEMDDDFHSNLSILQYSFLYAFALSLGTYMAMKVSHVMHGGAIIDDDEIGGPAAHDEGAARDLKDKLAVSPSGGISRFNTPRTRRVLHSIVALGLILCFAFVVEHTDVIPSVAKSYDVDYFWFLSGLLLIAAVLTIRKSRGNADVLNRDQTEEWKGWMQFLFLRKLWCAVCVCVSHAG
jgi:hypothetical protein